MAVVVLCFENDHWVATTKVVTTSQFLLFMVTDSHL
jgi:hypothetical protein